MESTCFSIYTVEELVRTLGHPNYDAKQHGSPPVSCRCSKASLFSAMTSISGSHRSSDRCLLGRFCRPQERVCPGVPHGRILRIWRAFCVNHERDALREPENKKEGKAKAEELQAETQPPAHLLLRDSLLARGFRSSEDGYSG